MVLDTPTREGFIASPGRGAFQINPDACETPRVGGDVSPGDVRPDTLPPVLLAGDTKFPPPMTGPPGGDPLPTAFRASLRNASIARRVVSVCAASGDPPKAPTLVGTAETPDFADGCLEGDRGGKLGVTAFSRSFTIEASVGSMKLKLRRELALDAPGDVMSPPTKRGPRWGGPGITNTNKANGKTAK